MLPENYRQDDLLTDEMHVTPTILENLVGASKWGKFLSIVGFISCALMVLGALSIAATSASTSRYSSGVISPGVLAILYIGMAIMFFLPCLYLYRFASKTMEAARNNQQESMEDAIQNLKAMFRTSGIVTIILLIFYVLAIAMVVIGLNR